jgi:protein TonB
MPDIAILPAAVEQTRRVEHPEPKCPDLARTEGVFGTVVPQANVGADGSFSSLYGLTGPAMLQQAALDAVWKWTYKPYTSVGDGRPQEVITTIKVSFPAS